MNCFVINQIDIYYKYIELYYIYLYSVGCERKIVEK